VAKRLETLWAQHPRQAPLGINLGKAKVTPLENAPQDYCTCFRRLRALGDYFVVNVSSPNTPGLRSLQAPEALSRILEALQTENHEAKPLLVKIAPDLAEEDLLAVIEVAHTYKLAGLIATNTTLSRDHLKTQILPQTGQLLTQESGGISGAPLRERSTAVIRFLHRHTHLPIIGVGGIFSVEDAWEKLEAGATLLQVYTGWIYEGPWMIKRILTGLKNKYNERLETQ
jgi:dihydroorotate dehydrogenase